MLGDEIRNFGAEEPQEVPIWDLRSLKISDFQFLSSHRLLGDFQFVEATTTFVDDHSSDGEISVTCDPEIPGTCVEDTDAGTESDTYVCGADDDKDIFKTNTTDCKSVEFKKAMYR